MTPEQRARLEAWIVRRYPTSQIAAELQRLSEATK